MCMQNCLTPCMETVQNVLQLLTIHLLIIYCLQQGSITFLLNGHSSNNCAIISSVAPLIQQSLENDIFSLFKTNLSLTQQGSQLLKLSRCSSQKKKKEILKATASCFSETTLMQGVIYPHIEHRLITIISALCQTASQLGSQESLK